ncbi:MAG TPA: M48 family metalloprotease, partial [Gaiellaceae bacterium]|nr:M48 family metalloprotease [Gaiellaceae bacterium]
MKRRPLGRDLGLTIRMAVALIPIVVWYLVAFLLLIVLVVGTLVDRQWSAFLGAVLFAVGGPVLLWEHIHRSETVALRAARAKELGEDDDPDLQALVARVAAMADLPPSRVALARSWAPNAFSVGLNERRAVVAVTSELLRRDLTTAELEAVVAHELAHVANRDGLVMTFVSVPALAGSAMWHAEGLRGKILFLLFYWPVFLVSLFLMWTLSRYREYVADRGAALITGAPEQLMSALQKIAGRPARGDLR